MELRLAVKQAYNFLLQDLKKGGGQGNTYIVFGGRGCGLDLMLEVLENSLRGQGTKVIVSRHRQGLDRLSLYNSILDAWFERHAERDLDRVYREFAEMAGSGKECVILVDGLGEMDAAGLDTFLHVTSMLDRSQVFTVAFFSLVPGQWQDMSAVLQVFRGANIIALRQAEFEDMVAMAGAMGLRLPLYFFNELWKVINHDLSWMGYAISYYRSLGIIDEEGHLEEAKFRYLPVPPRLEIYYHNVYSSLNDVDRRVAEILSFIEMPVDIETLSLLSGMDRAQLASAIDSLVSKGLVREVGTSYEVVSRQVASIFLERMTAAVKRTLAERALASGIMDRLPIRLQVRILAGSDQRKQCEDFVRKNYRLFVGKLDDISEAPALIERLRKHVDDPGVRRLLDFMECDCLYETGRYEDAIACIESKRLEEVDMEASVSRYALSLISLGRFSDAIKFIEGMTPGARSQRVVEILGEAYFRSKKYDIALSLAREAAEMAERAGDRETLGHALNLCGSVFAEQLQYEKARPYFEKALEIKRELGDWMSVLRTLNNIAIVDSFSGNFVEAIGKLTEIINDSFRAGDLVSRLYASYNISELYHMLGRDNESLSYMKDAERLLHMAEDKTVGYLFNRFAAHFHIDHGRYEEALKHSSISRTLADNLGNRDWAEIAMAMEDLSRALLLSVPLQRPQRFKARYGITDEFLPTFYALGACYFTRRGMVQDAMEVASLAVQAASSTSDYYGQKVGEAMQALASLLNGGVPDRIPGEECMERVPTLAMFGLLAQYYSASLRNNGEMVQQTLNMISSLLSRRDVEYMNFMNVTLVEFMERSIGPSIGPLQDLLFSRVDG